MAKRSGYFISYIEIYIQAPVFKNLLQCELLDIFY